MRIKRSSLLVHQILPSEEANPYRHFVTVQEGKQYLLFPAHVTSILLTFAVYCISESLPLVSDILYFGLDFFSPSSFSLFFFPVMFQEIRFWYILISSFLGDLSYTGEQDTGNVPSIIYEKPLYHFRTLLLFCEMISACIYFYLIYFKKLPETFLKTEVIVIGCNKQSVASLPFLVTCSSWI